MNYEEQILELKKRIEVLEKAENKRIAKRKREITFRIIKFIITVVIIVIISSYVYNNYIKPYKEKIDNFEQKVDTVEDFVTDKWEIIQDFNPFS